MAGVRTSRLNAARQPAFRNISFSIDPIGDLNCGAGGQLMHALCDYIEIDLQKGGALKLQRCK
jgi:hypothetical protein